ncbi:MAG: heparinase [Rhodomicrobium sp.]|nr:heparinase [Rhodomicrobium sp.]
MRRVLTANMTRALIGAPTAHQLLLIPQDLRTADPSFASELYDGYFGLAGTVALTGSESPFGIQPPSVLWQKELYAMGWLHNLEAAGDEIAREKARALIAEWIAHAKSAPAIAMDVDIVARRIIAILSHAGFLLEGAKPHYYEMVMKALSAELHYLTVTHADPGNTAPRLRALTALLLAGLCIAEQKTNVAVYLPIFSAELERQILPDGGHISRNPGALVDLLLDFLPLKQCFLARSQETPEALNSAIRRMMALIRFLRLGDGSLARFNGMGATRSDLTAAVLAYADYDEMPRYFAPDSGYCRMQRGKTVIIADTGSPPPFASSAQAHAGFLGFEMTSDIEPVIVNCGAPRDDTSDWAIAARSTAAHSTLTISDVSSSRLVKRRIGYPPQLAHLLSGPRSVRGEVKEDQGDLLLRAIHDGYKDRSGFLHQRRLRLTANGRSVEGVDQLSSPAGKPRAKESDSFAIHFHLHPRVSPRLDAEENSVSLTLPDAQLWKFRAAARASISRRASSSPIRSSRSAACRSSCAANAPRTFRWSGRSERSKRISATRRAAATAAPARSRIKAERVTFPIWLASTRCFVSCFKTGLKLTTRPGGPL